MLRDKELALLERELDVEVSTHAEGGDAPPTWARKGVFWVGGRALEADAEGCACGRARKPIAYVRL